MRQAQAEIARQAAVVQLKARALCKVTIDDLFSKEEQLEHMRSHMRAHMGTHMHAATRPHGHIATHAYARAYTRAHAHTCTHTKAHTHQHAQTCTHIYTHAPMHANRDKHRNIEMSMRIRMQAGAAARAGAAAKCFSEEGWRETHSTHARTYACMHACARTHTCTYAFTIAQLHHNTFAERAKHAAQYHARGRGSAAQDQRRGA